ncbi:MAG: hypothetical protein M3R36_00175 [Bacteroidota bacterium]|nr:hypothetical protein [Bacteroidota bacterium]
MDLDDGAIADYNAFNFVGVIRPLVLVDAGLEMIRLYKFKYLEVYC